MRRHQNPDWMQQNLNKFLPRHTISYGSLFRLERLEPEFSGWCISIADNNVNDDCERLLEKADHNSGQEDRVRTLINHLAFENGLE